MYEFTTFYLSVHQQIHVWVFSTLLILWLVLLWNFVYRFLWEHVFISFGILGVEVLSHSALCASFLRYWQTVFHFAYLPAMLCCFSFFFFFIDPRGTGGCFWPGRGSWGPQSHQRSDWRKNWPGMSPPWGRVVYCVLSWSIQAASHRRDSWIWCWFCKAQGEQPPNEGVAAWGELFLLPGELTVRPFLRFSESPHTTFDFYSSQGNVNVKCLHI